jgi:iron-sulfur cluster protein
VKELALPKFGWLPNIKYVQIQTHSLCNADCVFCPYIESEHYKHPGRMTERTWKLILDNLAPFREGINSGKVCPYLMQEPLLDKTLSTKIKDVYRYFPNTCVEVSTNGAALVPKVVNSLLEAFNGKRHDIWVSHHGINSETFSHIMKIDYEKSTDNLLYLLKASNGKYTIKIRGAGESHDLKHVYFTREQYLDYWKELFAKHNINTANVSIDSFRFHDRAGTLHRTDRGANLLNMGTVRKIDPSNRFHCVRLDEWIHFMHDGKIRLCCMDYHGEVELPNVNNTSLLEYFQGPEYYSLIEKVSGRVESEENFICKRCTSPGG